MKNISLSIISAVLLFLGSSAAQAETIGKVLVAVGDTSALRNGVVVKLVRGAEVQSGDTLRTGETSNMQVRFTDESITALRANSEFRIDDYKFEGGTNVGKSFFSLVKGGMRSITGLIGRFNRENYAVKASTATIGIRGTHFALVQCSSDCFNKDGSQAENGLFGGVTDGRIAVNNQSGEREFGKNEFFHVPSSDTSPKPLLTPPSFLRDQLEGQAKNKEDKTTVAKAAAAGEGEAENGDKASAGEDNGSTETAAASEEGSAETAAASEGGSTETAAAGGETSGTTTAQQTGTSATTQPTGGTALVEVAVNTSYVPTEQAVVQTNVSGGVIVPAGGQSYPYRYAWVSAWTGISNKPFQSGGIVYGGNNWAFGYSDAGIDQGTLTVLDAAQLQLPDPNKMLFADIVVNQGTPLTFFANAYTRSGTWPWYDFSGTNCFNNCTGVLDGTASFTWTKTASTNMGSDALAGNLSWGRYDMAVSGTVLTGTFAGQAYSEINHEHWATGDPVVAFPTAGTYSYSHIGGTLPTDQLGNVGTAVTSSAVGITFNPGGASVTLSGASWTINGRNYGLSFSNQAVTISQQPYSFSNVGWSDTGTTTSISPIVVTATCAGTGCSAATVTATASPMLFGANAQGLATGISTRPAPVNGFEQPGERTSSVQVYKVAGTPPL